MLCVNDVRSLMNESPATSTPVILPSWLASRMIATPDMYPVRTGLLRSSPRKPNRSTPASSAYAPTKRASTAASEAYFAGSPSARGASAAAVSKAVVDSGPTDSRCDEPTSA